MLWLGGDKGAWLRQQGLYAAQLGNWRKTLDEQGTQGLEPKAGGRKPKDPREKRIEALPHCQPSFPMSWCAILIIAAGG